MMHTAHVMHTPSALSWELPGFEELREHGRQRLREGARRAIERHGVAGVPLEALPDAALLDPRVHAFFHLRPPSRPLAQVLVGFLPRDARPARIEVVADDRGVVHVAGAGAWPGCPAGARLELAWDGDWVLRGAVQRRVLPRRVVGTSIELDERGDPGLSRILNGDDASHELGGPGVAARHREAVEHGVGWLVGLCDRYGDELCRDCRVLRLFQSTTLRSCANVGAYGAAFVQCEDDATAVFFAEDVAHQVGHVTFYGVTADPRRCFRVPPRVCVGDLGGKASDRRSLFDALHGNFTIARMAAVFDGLLSSPGVVLEPLERAEVCGRLAQALRRFGAGLRALDDERLFTAEIWRVHRAWWGLYEQLSERHRDVLAGVDLGGQGYVFSWSKFRERNGLG